MYKVLIDSCGEIPECLQADERFCSVPLQLEVGGEFFTDDASFNQETFLSKMETCPTEPHSACPSPEAFIERMGQAARTYMITLSSKVSGSFNSAMLASNIYKEEVDAHAQIDVIDSLSASVGETLIALKIRELEDMHLSFEEIKRRVRDYMANMHTYFVCETLDTFRKSGRLTGVKSIAAGVLNIKPICAAENGIVAQLGQARGIKKALNQMVDYLLENTTDCKNKTLAIAHCACPDRAEYVKSLIEKVAEFKDIIVVNASGVSTMYTNRGGIIISA